MIDIKGLDKADVLIALYERAKCQGLGYLSARKEPITRDEAKELIRGHRYFDYLYGRAMKVDITGDTFDERLYDRDNGTGTAQRAIYSICKDNG